MTGPSTDKARSRWKEVRKNIVLVQLGVSGCMALKSGGLLTTGIDTDFREK